MVRRILEVGPSLVVHGLHGSGVVCNTSLVRPAMVAYALEGRALLAAACNTCCARWCLPSTATWQRLAVVNNRNNCSLLQVARSAQLVATIEEPYHLPGGDSRWFLD